MPPKFRATALVCALCVFLNVFCACSAQKTVLSYRSQTLSERLYRYSLMLQKTKTLSAITGTTENLEDSEELWLAEDAAGVPLGEKLLQSVYDEACISLFYKDYAAQNGVEPTKEKLAEARQNADNIVAAFSSRAAFDRYMQPYGADYDLILDYYTDLAKTEAGMKAYFSAPVTALTPADCRAYFRDRYLTCRFFFISLAAKTLPNGKAVPLSDEERAAAEEEIERLTLALEQNEPIGEGVDEGVFSDGAARTIPLSLIPDELRGALRDASPGVFSLETDKGVYVCEKCAFEEDAFDTFADEIYTAAVSEREEAILAEHGAQFVKNEAFFAALSAAKIPIFSD